MTEPTEVPEDDGGRFRSTLARVLAVELITLIVLWMLQSRYS